MRHPPTMHTCSLSMVAHSYGLAVLKHSSSFAHSEFSVLTDSVEHSLVFAQTVRANGCGGPIDSDTSCFLCRGAAVALAYSGPHLLRERMHSAVRALISVG